MPPTRIYFANGSSVVVLEELDEVERAIGAVKYPLDTVVFTDKEARTPDRRIVLVASHIDYCKQERVSI